MCTPLFKFPYCCLCFKELTEEECAVDEHGQKWDVCKPCYKTEKQHKKLLDERNKEQK